jgi:C1A family cysteine protease
VPLSQLFLYNASRSLLGWRGDCGATLRASLKAVAALGIPRQTTWDYDIRWFDVPPNALVYSKTVHDTGISYARLDGLEKTGVSVLTRLKLALADGFPVVFGFSVYNSVGSSAEIPLPGPEDQLLGGHAVMAVGYDDGHGARGAPKGAILFRNSWGNKWGAEGYGYLPYGYVERQLATDFWMAYKADWLSRSDFRKALA